MRAPHLSPSVERIMGPRNTVVGGWTPPLRHSVELLITKRCIGWGNRKSTQPLRPSVELHMGP
eukprot:5539436-Pyramimonas_sp.AAC.1